MSTSIQNHPVVSAQEWLEARKALLADEKAFTRQRDALSEKRRGLPWVKVEKRYTFDTPEGKKTLADLFEGRSQLAVYHFMFGPGWGAGCPRCSMAADHFDRSVIHLAQRDVTLTAISRAPLAEIEAFKKRMGWTFPWASSYGSDFNYDYRVSFTPEEMERGNFDYNYGRHGFPADEATGTSIFYQDAEGNVFHTYSSYARGGEGMLVPYHFLDIAPKGRDEEYLRPDTMSWVRHHDRYEGDGASKKMACGCEDHA
ncbi:MAG TPA: DUF899 domain-containing protein [Alloacidobacterium sp.]|nr:DUF899 domain-containing protein [Alloacidobacterium sp.]